MSYILLSGVPPQADPSPAYERTAPKGPGYSNAQKWIDSYTMPGQFIGVRLPPPTSSPNAAPHVAARLYSLASSPYESRRDSAYFDASIIEVGRAPPEAGLSSQSGMDKRGQQWSGP